MNDAGVGGQTAIFHAATQFGDDGLPMVQWLVEHGADLTVRATIPGHYDRPDEVVECTPLGYALLFVNEPPAGDGSTVAFCENEAASSESMTPAHMTHRRKVVNQRVKLSASMTVNEFENRYWYATELKDFAQVLGIPSASKLRKDELERAIRSFW